MTAVHTAGQPAAQLILHLSYPDEPSQKNRKQATMLGGERRKERQKETKTTSIEGWRSQDPLQRGKHMAYEIYRRGVTGCHRSTTISKELAAVSA